jgi:hypothetical protein
VCKVSERVRVYKLRRDSSFRECCGTDLGEARIGQSSEAEEILEDKNING